jgi:acylphosphatase
MTETAQQRLHARVHGRVQGVSFRHHTTQQARQLGLTGWVANREDRTVEVVAEGEKTSLDALLRWLHHGPPAARVERVAAEWMDATGEFVRFQIEYEG